MAREHLCTNRQPYKLKGDEETPRIYGKASRRLGENFYRGAKGDIR